MAHLDDRPLFRTGIGLAGWVLTCFLLCQPSFAQPIEQAISHLKQIEPGGVGISTTSRNALLLQQADPSHLETVLNAMDTATPLGRNWLTAVANRLYQRSSAPSTAMLQNFLADQNHHGETRFLVFQWLTKDSPTMREQMLDRMTNDSSQELRFHAIAQALRNIPTTDDDAAKGIAIKKLQQLFEDSRHPEQVVAIATQLNDLGIKVDQAAHFGFVAKWNLIGPFDNVGSENFDEVFPIEVDLLAGKFDSATEYDGKSGKVKWQDHETNQPNGLLDLNPIFNREKGAIVYGRSLFNADQAQDCEIRIGCINGSKVWLNGELILSNNVYHMGTQIDQYVGKAKLKSGQNEIVIKICQNEQYEQFAQEFAFQLRVCDAQGKAILPKRP